MRVLVAQQPEDRVDAAVVARPAAPCRTIGGSRLAERGDRQRDLLRRQHLVDHAGAHRAERHAVELRGVGLSQNTTPPALLISWMPREPSLPLPERTTATARSPTSCASERKKRSIGSVRPCRGSRSFSSSRRCRMIISFIGGSR